MIIDYAAQIYVFKMMVGAYAAVAFAVIGLIIGIILFIKKKHDTKPMTFFLRHPKFAQDCLSDEKWCARNPDFSIKLRKKLEKTRM